MQNLNKFVRVAIVGPVIALFLAVVLITFTTDRFMTAQNLMNVSLQVSAVAIAAIGGTMVILTGGIDLSPGSSVALTTCVLAVLVKLMGLPLLVGILVVLVMGAAQKYLGTTRDPYGSLTLTQQLTQESFILGFQFELAGLPTTHNSSPVLVSTDE